VPPAGARPCPGLALAVAVAVAVGVACTAPAPGPDPAATAGANAVVVRVVDGDTLVAAIGGREETTRLIGIDTPETKRPDTPVECFGPEASARLQALLPPGTPVRLELDEEARDRYGRLLAYVHRSADGAFVNEVLATEGLADALSIAPNTTYDDRFASAVAAARAERAGLWGACPDAHAPGS
jgi:micrococcal nuclease